MILVEVLALVFAAFFAGAVGAAIILANWPYTLLIIMPTNLKLIATKESDVGPNTVSMIQHWGKLHAVRTILGLVATGFFAWALIK